MPLFLVASVTNASGIAKKTGNPFNMKRVSVLTPFRETKTPNFQNQGVGLAPVELSLPDNLYDQVAGIFRDKFKGQPVPMDFETALDSRDGLIIIGVKA